MISIIDCIGWEWVCTLQALLHLNPNLQTSGGKSFFLSGILGLGLKNFCKYFKRQTGKITKSLFQPSVHCVNCKAFCKEMSYMCKHKIRCYESGWNTKTTFKPVNAIRPKGLKVSKICNFLIQHSRQQSSIYILLQ